jgi:hypothetical protein
LAPLLVLVAASSVRRSHVTTTGSSEVRVFSASKRRIAPRRTTISIGSFFLQAARGGVLRMLSVACFSCDIGVIARIL